MTADGPNGRVNPERVGSLFFRGLLYAIPAVVVFWVLIGLAVWGIYG